MNGHLTEQQLIDYEFKLTSEAAMVEARTHLAGCEACRRKLEELRHKFGALDLLRDEITASEGLLSKVVENATGARRGRVIPLQQFPWLGATAAAVIVGFALLLVSERSRDHAPKQRVVGLAYEEGQSSAVVESGKGDARARSARSPAAPATKPAEPMVTATSTAPRYGIAEEPPFAPASAIELVVLPRRENVQLTIYNAADLTLARERRNLTLKKGWNWLQFMWANTLIDPTSLSLEPLEHKDQVEIQQLVFPPRLRELGRWLIRSEVSGQVPFELTYFTSGLSWRAFYMGTLSHDEKMMHLEGYVRVGNNSGEDYEDAQTRLIVGQVHLLDQIGELALRQYPYGSPEPRTAGDRYAGPVGEPKDGVVYYAWARNGKELGQVLGDLERKEIRKEGLSEYFLYTIEGTETIPNQWGKRLLSFQADDIPVEGLYKYDEERWGAQAIRFLSFANDADHELGETPIPDGQFRIYGRVDANDHLSYVGGTSVKYIPVGEEVELELGPARLVKVEPTLMDLRTENYVFDKKDDIAGWDEVRTWKIEVANARTLPVEIEVTRGFGTPYWTLEPGAKRVPYEKHDATHARFTPAVGPRSKETFEYTVTTYHGVRAEALSNATLKKGN